jgi:arabinofuranan 3-O-arabinosyltransferase
VPIPRPLRGRAVEVALAVLAFLLALAQRPGRTLTDTKIDLHVDPAGFLGDVLSAWSDTGDLGHVQGGQYGGYAFPMAPFFALGHALGVAPWLVQRLWLGLILALAAWGAARLAAQLGGGTTERAAAGLLYLLNPYVVIFVNRTSITLLAYAALPWLMLCTYRGLRNPRGWAWPAGFALIVTASGGGVNAAVLAWVLLGPILLALYEARWRALLSFGWRTGLASLLVSLWWIAPLLVQSRYGVDFLAFTEQPGTIWSTSSLSESLRLMGYWVSYLGVGYSGTLRPYFGDGGVMLFKTPVVLATLLVPALAVAGLVWTRRRRYAPFALLLLLVGLLVMSAGFPEGTPLRRGVTFAYNHVAALQFLRTTHKAGPLVALAIALLGGMAAAEIARRRRAILVLGAALVVLSVWPLARGHAVEGSLTFDRVPAAWKAAQRHVDARGGRALVLPGQLYANYTWGGTVDPLLPAIARTPVAARFAVPYADLRATELLWTTDALVQQRRAVPGDPGQLSTLLDLIGASTVVSAADDNRALSGAVPPSDAADMLDGLGGTAHRWGASKDRARAAGTLGEPRRLAQVRAYDRGSAGPLVRLQPDGIVVDGGADAVAALAALGPLPGTSTRAAGLQGALRGRFVYAPDTDAAAIRRAPVAVIADGNRRRVFVVSRMAQNVGATLAAGDPISEDAAVLNPFGGTDSQTVAVLEGVASIRAPFSPGFPQFPEHRPYAALDGDSATYWESDRALEPDRHWLEVRFNEPRDVPYVDLTPYNDHLCTVLAVEIAGRRFQLRPGVNRLALDLHGVRSLRVQIAQVRRAPGVRKRAGGIRELAIPGIHVTEALRPPVVAERALAGHSSGTALLYLFQRTTGDDPFRRDPWHGPATAGLVRDRGDAEQGLERVFSPPDARTWEIAGLVSPAAGARDSDFDGLLDVHGRFDSAARFQGRPQWRASSAFDGTATPWIGSWMQGHTTWLEWATPRERTVRELTLDAAPRVRAPREVRLNGVAATVGPGGRVTLPRPVRGRTFRLEIVRASFPAGTPGQDRQARAVGIAEIRGAGIPHVTVKRRGRFDTGCYAAGTLGGRELRLRLQGDIADLDAGRPMRVQACGTIALPAGETRLSMPAGTFAPYLMRLAAAPTGRGHGYTGDARGQVLSQGRADRGSRRGIRLRLDAPAWLVYAEAYNRGWRASCDGRDLGAPRPADGFAMSWHVSKSCRDVDLWFAPNRLVKWAGIVSAAVALALLALFALGRRGTRPDAEPAAREYVARRLPAVKAALLALVLSLPFGFVFAARATPLFALALFVILWRAIPTTALLATAGALLVLAVPVLTLAIGVDDRGGYDPDYAGERIAVHWVAASAVAILIFTLVRVLRRGRPGRDPGPSPPPPPASPAPRSRS